VETRKVQQTGGSSFIVSLPKGWIKQHGIKKNDTLGLMPQPDGNLLITPRIDSQSVEKKKVFDIDDINDNEYLFRLLIGAYIMGYSIFIVKSGRKIESKTRETIINFTQMVIGPEIIEETPNQMILKDLLNPKEMPFEKTIKRMYIIAESMHQDAIKALKTKDRELLEEVVKKDNDIDRLHWLIGRQASIMLDDIILAQKMEITLEEAHHFHLVSRLLERIADHALIIASNVLKLLESKSEIKEDVIEDITSASELALNLLISSFEAWLQRDIHKANASINQKESLVLVCEKIKIVPNKNINETIALTYIVESIRRTGEYSSDISELIINYLLM